ncbi:26S protease regulatory subunit 7 [Fasciola gigantica]|uniref:26S protease regulatory subunit 7 n=1 Tax=Fasciola gigantica TaxID=46835 RepID=A0A504YS76_FASGI|nr:26S protease regulatory subunit 7 [Fasciola gigantica]
MTQVEHKRNITCGNVGGCEEQTERPPKIIERPCLHPKQFVNLETEPPKDMLLFSASGNGKKLCARVVVNDTEACIIRVVDSELVRKRACMVRNRLV